ncbi:MAG: hypothetical protein ACR2LF_11145 [Jatrophihabitantaceae bacterium]
MGPMVLIMPAIMDGTTYQECVNGPRGMDETYLTSDVRTDVLVHFRVSPDPAQWGVGGYSSGGYCAANLALRHRVSFGAAAVLDGYYRAQDGPAAAALGNNRRAWADNSPLELAARLAPGSAPVPGFWMSAGSANRADYVAARAFVNAMRPVEQTTFVVEPGAGHNFYAWASVVPTALGWLWQQLASPDLRRAFPVSGAPTAIYVAPHLPPHRRHHQHRYPSHRSTVTLPFRFPTNVPRTTRSGPVGTPIATPDPVPTYPPSTGARGGR